MYKLWVNYKSDIGIIFGILGAIAGLTMLGFRIRDELKQPLYEAPANAKVHFETPRKSQLKGLI